MRQERKRLLTHAATSVVYDAALALQPYSAPWLRHRHNRAATRGNID